MKNKNVKPFLKWAGGKRQLLPIIQQFIPTCFERYFEPFVGGGSILFSLQPKNAVIGDVNKELINCYQVIKNPANHDLLFLACKKLEQAHCESFYYKTRSLDRSDDFNALSLVQKAARMLYLNKACFNGLYRVNKKGQFNVPIGRKTKPLKIFNPEVITAVGDYLDKTNTLILHNHFYYTLQRAKKNDFIYLDPPYHPVSLSASFSSYSSDGFYKGDQIELKKTCDLLSDKGCQLLISNSNCDFIRELWNDSRYTLKITRAKRAINCDGLQRGPVSEVLIYNKYECKSSI